MKHSGYAREHKAWAMSLAPSEFVAGKGYFEALTKCQFVTESSDNNGSANHHIWSFIKMLPLTLL